MSFSIVKGLTVREILKATTAWLDSEKGPIKAEDLSRKQGWFAIYDTAFYLRDRAEHENKKEQVEKLHNAVKALIEKETGPRCFALELDLELVSLISKYLNHST